MKLSKASGALEIALPPHAVAALTVALTPA